MTVKFAPEGLSGKPLSGAIMPFSGRIDFAKIQKGSGGQGA